MFDLLTLAEIEKVSRLAERIHVRRTVWYVPYSTTVVAGKSGIAVFRCLGAGGSGGSGAVANGGNGGTVGLRAVRVKAGDAFVVAIPAGGASVNNAAGLTGGDLTITGPGVNVNIPGGTGGGVGHIATANAANASPTGLDWHMLGGLGGRALGHNACGGGGAAALLVGGAAHAGADALAGHVSNPGRAGGAGVGGRGSADYGGGSGGPATSSKPGPNMAGRTSVASPACDLNASLLLMDVFGGAAAYVAPVGGVSQPQEMAGQGAGGGYYGASGGFGGGGAGGPASNGQANHGGRGGGGGGFSASGNAGAGGDGFVTIEWLEAEA